MIGQKQRKFEYCYDVLMITSNGGHESFTQTRSVIEWTTEELEDAELTRMIFMALFLPICCR